MMKYQHIERSSALALNDVAALQYLAKRQLHELENLARDANSLLVSSIVRSTCISINKSIDDAIDNARKLLR